MRQRYSLIGAVILAILFSTIFLFSLTVSVAQHIPTTPQLSTADISLPPPPDDYLIVLSVLPPPPAALPVGLFPEQAAQYARRLTYRQARPILTELERLRAENKVAHFQVRPDLHGVIVAGATPDALGYLSRLQGVAAVLPIKDEPPACAVAAAEALPEQLLGLSHVAAELALRLPSAGLAPQATDPSINARVSPGSDYTYFSGQTTANIAVTMRILRGGSVIASDSATSNSYGYYTFYPDWQECPSSSYNWRLRPGDVVEVTAHGSTVSTIIANLSAWVDPVADTVGGVTDPGRSVEVSLYAYGSDPCTGTSYARTVGTDGSGNFSASLSSQVDFDGRANASVYARDGNGNSTYASFYAYRISASFDSSSFWGYLKPEVDYTATLSRTGSIISTRSGESSAVGYYSASFATTIQSGDVISVSGGGANIQYTATSLDLTLDHVANQATGTTGSGRLVQTYFEKSLWWGEIRTACSDDWDCNSDVAAGSGAFQVTTTLDLVRGDPTYFYVYDAEGNYQYANRYVPAIVAELGWPYVSGYWGDPGASYVTVTLKDSGGGVKDTRSGVGVDSWDGEFSTWVGGSIAAADTIEVTDGAVTETMTVQNLTARLDGGSGHLTGNAGSGHLLADLEDFRRESGYWYSYCSETAVAGPYDLTFSGAQVGGQDGADVWNAGPDGHYTYRYPHAFTVNATKDDDYVSGYSETPNTQVTVTLKSGATTKAVYTTTSLSDGYYDDWLSSGTPVTITQGDTLQVQTGDGDSVVLTIPELTANVDGANNRIYGRSPANEPVRAQVRRHYRYGWYSESQYITADGSGNYSAGFDGVYWYRDCSPVQVGHPCSQPAVYYHNAAGHRVEIEGARPQPVGPDIYESDNISTTASSYAGIQSHTFHTYTDTDWVSFIVSADDVSVTISIETLNLGWEVNTVLYLYDTDGSTQLAYDYSSGPGYASLINWTPLAAGTYYIKVVPYSNSSTSHCDARYDLMIVRSRVYLPMTIRNY